MGIRIQVAAHPLHIRAITVIHKGCSADSFFCYGTVEPGTEVLRNTLPQRSCPIGHRRAQKAYVFPLERIPFQQRYIFHTVSRRISLHFSHTNIPKAFEGSEVKAITDKQPLRQQKHSNANQNHFPFLVHNRKYPQNR